MEVIFWRGKSYLRMKVRTASYGGNQERLTEPLHPSTTLILEEIMASQVPSSPENHRTVFLSRWRRLIRRQNRLKSAEISAAISSRWWNIHRNHQVGDIFTEISRSVPWLWSFSEIGEDSPEICAEIAAFFNSYSHEDRCEERRKKIDNEQRRRGSVEEREREGCGFNKKKEKGAQADFSIRLAH